MKKIFMLLAIAFAFAACGNGEVVWSDVDYVVLEEIAQPPPVEPEPEYVPDIEIETVSGELIITFEFTAQSGWASNQYAVWIEDIAGNHIRTLAASRWTATGGFNTRDMSLPMWVEASGVVDMAEADVDVISSPTPYSGMLTYIWNLTDMEGNAVPAGEYRFIVEGTTRWNNHVIFEGIIDTRYEFAIVSPEPVFIHEASEEFPALHETSEENYMISSVTALFMAD